MFYMLKSAADFDPTVLHAGLGRRQAEGNTLQVRGQFTVGRANKTGCTNSGH
jgi:hypothetical protein